MFTPSTRAVRCCRLLFTPSVAHTFCSRFHQGDYSKEVAAAMAGDTGTRGPCECRTESAAEAAATKASGFEQGRYRSRLSATSRFAELVCVATCEQRGVNGEV